MYPIKKTNLFMPLLYLRLPWMPVILFSGILLIVQWKHAKLFLVCSILVAILVNLLFIVSTFTNAVQCIQLYRTGEIFALRKRMKKVKFGSIPYFILNFILWLLFTFLMFAASRGTIIFTPIPLLLFLPVLDCYFCVVATSPAAVVYALALKKNGKLTGKKTAALIIALFLFLTDIIAVMIMVCSKELRLNKQE